MQVPGDPSGTMNMKQVAFFVWQNVTWRRGCVGVLLAGLALSLPAGRCGVLRGHRQFGVVDAIAVGFSDKQRPFWCVWEALSNQSFPTIKIQAFLVPGGG